MSDVTQPPNGAADSGARPDSPSGAAALEVLAGAARALHGDPDAERALSWACDAALRATGAEASAVCIVGGGRPATWTTSQRLAGVVIADIGDPRPIPELAPALRGERAVQIDDIRSDDRLAARLQPLWPLRSLLAVPIPDDSFGAHGALLLAHRSPGWAGTAVRHVATALAAHIGVAVDAHAAVAHLEELRRVRDRVVHELQKAVRPPAPAVDGTELGVHYEAAEEHAPTGGDLYDWIVMPDGTLHVAVIDVMGKGVEATRDAVALTHALRALALDSPLEGLVARVDALVAAQHPDLVATAVVLRYCPKTGDVEVAGAGHPPPLHVSVRDHGEPEVRAIDAPGVPIGWPGAGSDGITKVRLERGDSLVLYTDGLVEATKDIVRGLDELHDHASDTAGYPAQAMARALVERALAGAARHDDSLALVIRRRVPPPAATGRLLGPFEHRLTRSLAAVPVARHLLTDWLRRLPVGDREEQDLVLVASELCTNALRHADAGDVILRARTEGTAVVLEVSDPGPGFDLPPDEGTELVDAVAPTAERGRGLLLARALCDRVYVGWEGTSHIVRVAIDASVPNVSP